MHLHVHICTYIVELQFPVGLPVRTVDVITLFLHIHKGVVEMPLTLALNHITSKKTMVIKLLLIENSHVLLIQLLSIKGGH
jgi:hypothetical protein